MANRLQKLGLGAATGVLWLRYGPTEWRVPVLVLATVLIGWAILMTLDSILRECRTDRFARGPQYLDDETAATPEKEGWRG